jgi:general stress protein 26
MRQNRNFRQLQITFINVSLILIFLISALTVNAQPSVNRDSVLLAAREIIKETTYCALITVDSTGQPQVRTMNPFPLNDEFITWFATSRTSRKVMEIKSNPKVSVYFANHISAKGYVNITGTAEVIDDKELLLKMKRDYWNGIPNWQNIFVLIKIVPKTIEVINYKHGLNNDPNTFRAPAIVF